MRDGESVPGDRGAPEGPGCTRTERRAALVAQNDGRYALADEHVGALLDEAIGYDEHR